MLLKLDGSFEEKELDCVTKMADSEDRNKFASGSIEVRFVRTS